MIMALRKFPAQQPNGCCLLPVRAGRASGAPMPGGGSRGRGEHRRTLAVRAARGMWAAPKCGHQWGAGGGHTQPVEKAVLNFLDFGGCTPQCFSAPDIDAGSMRMDDEPILRRGDVLLACFSHMVLPGIPSIEGPGKSGGEYMKNSTRGYYHSKGSVLGSETVSS